MPRAPECTTDASCLSTVERHFHRIGEFDCTMPATSTETDATGRVAEAVPRDERSTGDADDRVEHALGRSPVHIADDPARDPVPLLPELRGIGERALDPGDDAVEVRRPQERARADQLLVVLSGHVQLRVPLPPPERSRRQHATDIGCRRN